ncbi:MAG: DUF106 domain-containing protein [ANME-2 cluster archaeon]|nr:DUF106 domain-containing protein [ANME-2 cluster archaeon]MBC2700061.1 DUF106 domain-containing protein [ANME-2 cluster archaeon]MBC2707422.1 DUF106 domain-containing protein [ANME-2 cluster archaeon]MBC2763627.1 DUF106 domain-containing protein [ANME-2 cluster archaeon]
MPKSDFKQTLERAALALGFGMMFGIILLGERFRIQVGEVVQILLGPLPDILPFHIMLFVMAAITGLYASLIQKYTMDWELMRRVQDQMKNFQKEFREAQLADNQAKVKKLEAERSAMMNDQMQMTKQQFKPMAYISIISLPLFMWAYLYIGEHPDPVLIFPFWGEKSLTGFALGPIQYWIYWYFICSLPISQIIRKSLNIGGV